MTEAVTKEKIKNHISEIISISYFPLSLIYLEIALKIKSSPETNMFWFPAIMFSASLGIITGMLCLLIRNKTLRCITSGLLLFGICLYFAAEVFIKSAYRVFMTIDSIAQGTGGVLTDFSEAFFKAIANGFWIILFFFLPFILFVLITAIKKINFEHGVFSIGAHSLFIGSVIMASALCIEGLIAVYSNSSMLGIYRDAYNFSNAVSSFGLITGTTLDIRYSIFGDPTAGDFVINENDASAAEDGVSPDDEARSDKENSADEDSSDYTEIEYGYNVTDIDFDTIIANTSNQSVMNVHKYVQSLSGTKKNAYTGLFEGKNLILITAESFSAEVIDEELTPTLYRLANNGIKFTDFYQPTWGGSTSTGEYSILTGLVPTSGVSSILKIADCNLSFTIGNKLKDKGYFSAAYHDGTYTYYSRNLTHTKFGYDSFIAFGNGLENGVSTNVWPASDLEMMQYTISDYIDKEPFSVYYMSVSGHGFYTNFNNGMSTKNRSEVEDLDYSTTVKAYLAANLELEHALTYLIGELEAAGIADNTVIAICPDHYPYALEKGESWGNSEDYLGELYGYTVTNSAQRDHNAFVLWSGCLENENSDMAATISSPTYSLDILPTLCNLFGVEYDSRLLVGRDVFSDAEALVIWPDYNWKTERGYYDYTRKQFIASDGSETVDNEYIEYINTIVKNKIAYSKAVINYDYFSLVSAE